jgi:hypothetical protein
MAICPECEFDELDADDVEEGETLDSLECGEELVLVALDQLRVVVEDEDDAGDEDPDD